MASRTVVVGGGTGFIGQNLTKLASSRGYNVVNIARMPGANNISWSCLEYQGLPRQTFAAVNLAGQQFMDFTKSWTPGFKQNVENSRIYTTKALATAINKAEEKPKVFVLITGVGAYEPSETEKYDESSPTNGIDFFSRLTVQWERAAQVDPPVRLVIIRSGVVLGRWGGMIKNMILPFYFGLGGRIGNGKQYLPWIHINDLSRLIMFAIENEHVSGILNGVAPEIVTNEQFTQTFAKALNRPAIFPIPERVLNFLLNHERAMVMTKGQYVIPKRVLDYGFKYKYGEIAKACMEFSHLLPTKHPLK